MIAETRPWFVGPAATRTIDRLAADAPARWGRHRLAGELVKALSAEYRLPAAFDWGWPADNGHLPLPKLVIGYSDVTVPGFFVVRADAPDVAATAAHEFHHQLEIAGLRPDVTIASTSPGGRCSVAATEFGEAASRWADLGVTAKSIATFLWADFPPVSWTGVAQ